ncbi:MAG: hypothetical protein B6229_00175 [Spirochaetaceae bacterium 4572_7]|nr:MAG: hypothetical protein B6229_00175 [Spirochaetaceae bacterium 4572_7]
MDDKLLNFEMKIAYLEDFVNQLNTIVTDQGVSIERLIEINKLLNEKIVLLEQNSKETRESTPPPHY